TRLVESKTVDADVAGKHRKPAGHLEVEAIAELGPQLVEGVVAQDLTVDACLGVRTTARPNEHDDFALRDRAEQPLDKSRAEKARRSGDANAFAREGLTDHARTTGRPAPRSPWRHPRQGRSP